MSHFTRVRTHITDMEHPVTDLTNLGHTVERNTASGEGRPDPEGGCRRATRLEPGIRFERPNSEQPFEIVGDWTKTGGTE